MTWLTRKVLGKTKTPPKKNKNVGQKKEVFIRTAQLCIFIFFTLFGHCHCPFIFPPDPFRQAEPRRPRPPLPPPKRARASGSQVEVRDGWFCEVAVGQNLSYRLFEDSYPPKVVYFKGFCDVHRGTGVLTHCPVFGRFGEPRSSLFLCFVMFAGCFLGAFSVVPGNFVPWL